MNLKQAKELVRGRLSDKRYEHTLNVKKMAVRLAKRYGVDEDKAALAAFAAENEEEIGFWKFVQYKFSTQWQAVKQYANDKGVQILGDIPIYVSADSVDAWVGGALFELDADGGFARVAGCPPDYFSADGQLWGNPLYRWDRMKADGFGWWIRRIDGAGRIFGRTEHPQHHIGALRSHRSGFGPRRPGRRT